MNRIYRAMHKALALTLMISIVAVGGFAIHLTHVHAEVTVSFGDPVEQKFAVADVIPQSMLMPVRGKK